MMSIGLYVSLIYFGSTPARPQDARMPVSVTTRITTIFWGKGNSQGITFICHLVDPKNEGLVGIPFPTSDGGFSIHLFRVGATDPKYESFHLKHTTSTHPPWICQKNYGLAHLFGQLAWKKNHPSNNPENTRWKKTTHPTVVSLASAWKFGPWITHKKWYLLPI